MVREIKAPDAKESEHFGGDTATVYEHDAFGTIALSIQTGGHDALFGSDINHNQRVSIRISRANLTRSLSRDWIHSTNVPIVEINMSHSQFAEFITSQGRGEGTPCTLSYAPARGTKTEMMPGIEKIETKAETFRKEIRESAKKQMEKISESIEELGKMLESGNLSKKALKELQHNMKCVAENTPSNMAFVVSQAEEALEKAVTNAKIEVEAMIEHNVNRLGLEAAKQLGLVQTDAPVLIEGEKS